MIFIKKLLGLYVKLFIMRNHGCNLDFVRKSQGRTKVTACRSQDRTDLSFVHIFKDVYSFEVLDSNVFKIPKINRVINMLESIHIAPDEVLGQHNRELACQVFLCPVFN